MNTDLDYTRAQRAKVLSTAARKVIPRVECLRDPDFTRPYTKVWPKPDKIAR
jgi:hypothetical protein